MQNLKETIELLLIGNLNWNKLNRRLRIELKIEKGTRSSFVRRINIVPNYFICMTFSYIYIQNWWYMYDTCYCLFLFEIPIFSHFLFFTNIIFFSHLINVNFKIVFTNIFKNKRNGKVIKTLYIFVKLKKKSDENTN